MSTAVKKPNLDSVTTINPDGSHFKLHPADVSGPFTAARRWFGVLLLGIYVALPWIPINGFPAVFLDLANRRFHLFGLTFVTQDLWLGFFFVAGLGFSLFYITSIFGRLWCGWTCPYTVFLEHVYRRIERWIEGDAAARRKLDREPWTTRKTIKRGVKHGLYVLVSLIIAHVFLSYFVSIPALYSYMQQSPLEHMKAFGVVIFLTAALYFSFSWFREQFCIIMCPYGRIQSALTDDDTVVIGYDEKRGEPRGRATDPNAGDCVSCNRCVQVCPTGIDIRNGLQLECVGCAACIDACDAIMQKLERPKGLIRYGSLNALQGNKTRFVRSRTIIYTMVMLVGASALMFSLTKVHDVDVAVMRMRGMPYFVTEETVRNQYQVRLTTKRNEATTFKVGITEAPEWLLTNGFEQDFVLEGQSEELHPFVVHVPREHYTGPLKLTLEVRSEPGGTLLQKEVSFLGPDPRLFTEP